MDIFMATMYLSSSVQVTSYTDASLGRSVVAAL